MKTYIVELSEAEDKALSIFAVSQQEWIDNVVHERCRVAIEEIVQSEVQRMLSEGKPIIGSRDDIVLEASVETAAERHARIEAEIKAQLEQQG